MAKKKKKMEFETMQVKLPHVKGLSIVLPVIYILWVAVMYYLLLPALNIHSRGLWLFVLGIILFPLGIIGALVSAARKAEGKSAGKLEKPVNGIFCSSWSNRNSVPDSFILWQQNVPCTGICRYPDHRRQ